MQQLIQTSQKDVNIVDVPSPQIRPDEVLVSTSASLIAPGAERLLLDYGMEEEGAKDKTDAINKVLTRIRQSGLSRSFAKMFNQVSEAEPLGASAAGEVVAVGRDLTGQYKPGDRVAMAGVGIASHAEMNAVPAHLVAKLPERVDYNQACFAALAAEAAQAVAHANVKLGDHVLVIGLGLTGQLTTQIAAAAGGRVFGVDYDAARVALALQHGCHEVQLLDQPEAASNAQYFTRGRGFDAVVVCAMTDATAPLELASEWAKQGARIILAGKTGNSLPYSQMKDKELELIVSSSDGPRPAHKDEDDDFKRRRHDYLVEVLELMEEGKLQVDELVTHTFTIENADHAYEMILHKTDRAMGVVLTYGRALEQRQAPKITLKPVEPKIGKPNVAAIGAGQFAKQVRFPLLKQLKSATLTGVASRRGLTARQAAESYGFAYATNQVSDLLSDMHTEAVMIATRPADHADMVCEALAKGKHVFVESPLAINMEKLEQVFAQLKETGQTLMVGYGRRYSPFVQALLDSFNNVKGPRQVNMRINAPRLAETDWRRTPEQGGRLLSDIGPYIDLACVLTQSKPESICTLRGQGEDVYSIVIKFTNGSMSNILFTTEGGGDGSEYVEMYGGNAQAAIDNFKSATFTLNNKTLKFGAQGDPLGYGAEISSFINRVNGSKAPLNQTAEDIFWSSLATLMALRSLREEKTILVKDVDN